MLDKLAGSTLKLESLVESLHNGSFSTEETQEVLHRSDIKQKTYEFFEYARKFFASKVELDFLKEDPFSTITVQIVNDAAKVESSEDWLSYLVNTGLYKTVDSDDMKNICAFDAKSVSTQISSKDNKHLTHLYDSGIKNSDEDMRRDVLLDSFIDILF